MNENKSNPNAPQISQSVSHVLTLTIEMDKLQQQLASKQQTIDQLTSSKSELESKTNKSEVEAQGKLESLQTQLTTLQQQYTADKHKHISENLQKEAEIFDLRQRMNEQTNEKVKGAAEKVRLSLSLSGGEDALQQENEKLKKTLSTLQSQQTTFRDIRDEYLVELQKLKDRDPEFLQSIFDEREDLKKQLASAKSTFKSKTYEMEMKIEELNRDKENVAKKFQDYEQNAAKKEKDMTALQSRLELITREKQSVEKEVNDLTVEVKRLKASAAAAAIATPASGSEEASTGSASTQKLLKGLFGKSSGSNAETKSGENKGATNAGDTASPAAAGGSAAGAKADGKLSLVERIALAKKAKEEQEKKRSKQRNNCRSRSC